MDAADNKGDPIHQQLMAKKMQKLDESTDFRPFKFRIQAFTAAFLEEARVFFFSGTEQNVLIDAYYSWRSKATRRRKFR